MRDDTVLAQWGEKTPVSARGAACRVCPVRYFAGRPVVRVAPVVCQAGTLREQAAVVDPAPDNPAG